MGAKSFTVHEPGKVPDDILARADGVIFVKDGFSWLASALPPIWCIANGLWLVFFGYLVAAAALGFSVTKLPGGAVWGGIAAIAFNLIFAFEANNLRRWTLRRKGFQMIGAVSGRTSEECERRFFEGWLGAVNVSSGGVSPRSPSAAPSEVQLAAAERDSIFNTSGPETPTRSSFVSGTSVRDAPVQDAPVRDEPVRDTAARNTSVPNVPVRGTSPSDKS